MDIELQIQKHLARDAHKTVAIIDEYCEEYKDLLSTGQKCRKELQRLQEKGLIESY